MNMSRSSYSGERYVYIHDMYDAFFILVADAQSMFIKIRDFAYFSFCDLFEKAAA